MSDMYWSKYVGEVLRRLIKENYPSQEAFAYDYGTDLRQVSRYINEGINKLDKIQELAAFFNVKLSVFLPPEE